MPEAKDELVLPEPFVYEIDPVAQEEAAAQELPAPISEDTLPSAPALE